MTTNRELLIAQVDDGSYIAISLAGPRFCVGGASKEAAADKAQEAFAYHEATHSVPRRATPRAIQVRTPEFESMALVA